MASQKQQKDRPKTTSTRLPRPSKADLDRMVDEAIVDANGVSEQVTGFYTMLENDLELPFNTTVLGFEVKVERLDLSDDDRILVVCRRGRERQRIPILDLPLPQPPPEGWKWIEAYRHWARYA